MSKETITGDSQSSAKTYDYDAQGLRLAMTNTPKDTTQSAETYTYGYDVHGSVSLLLKDTGEAKASYGYSAYGALDDKMSSGDKAKHSDGDIEDPLNAYRYTAKRFDTGSQTIDMGARRFGPDFNRFLQVDQYMGALADLSLSTDPLTANRYSLAGGNPITFVEVDGHQAMVDGGGTAKKSGGTTNFQVADASASSGGGDGSGSGGGSSSSGQTSGGSYSFIRDTLQLTKKDLAAIEVHGLYSAYLQRVHEDSMDAHEAADAFGLIPGPGDFVDAAHSVWYAADGRWGDAGLSAMSTIPAAGTPFAQALKRGDELVAASKGPSRLVGANRPVIDMRKIHDYVLNPAHPRGGNKARVFASRLGFTRHNAGDLVSQIRNGLLENTPVPGMVDKYGARFTIDMAVTGPKGEAIVRTGWIFDPGATAPRLLTAYLR